MKKVRLIRIMIKGEGFCISYWQKPKYYDIVYLQSCLEAKEVAKVIYEMDEVTYVEDLKKLENGYFVTQKYQSSKV